MDIEYSDGVEIEGRILSLIRQASDRGAHVPIAAEHYSAWPVRYHLCPERANLVRPFRFNGLDVLELGAGMGAVSRFVAENARSLYVVEGTQARFDVLSERLADLKNWAGEVGNFQDFQTPRRFDVVCLVGVLEYSELFLKPTGESPHLWLLKRCREFLKPGGVLILAIENSLGLKYWNASAEDHRATLFDSVVGYPDTPTPRTFSRKQLGGLLGEAGYSQIDEFFPFPDYKVPTTVISAALIERAPALSAELAGLNAFHDYLGHPSASLFPDLLALDNLSRAGLLGDFSNSFLFVASSEKHSAIRAKLLSHQLDGNELGWHYGHGRRAPTRTVFFGDRRGSDVLVRKTLLYSDDRSISREEGELGKLEWSALGPEALQTGDSLRLLLARHAYFQEWTAFQDLLESFLSWSLRRWAGKSSARLDGRALDAIFVNARLPDGTRYDPAREKTEFSLFDLEWRLGDEIPTSWFLFRNVFNLVRDEALLTAGAPFASFADYYEKLCARFSLTPDLAGDLQREARLQAATSRGSVEHHARLLGGIFHRPLPPARLPRDPSVESALRHPPAPWGLNLRSLRRLVKKLPGALKRRLGRRLESVPRFKRALRSIARRARSFAKAVHQGRRFFRPFPAHFLESELPASFTSLTLDFPRGYLLLSFRGPVPRKLTFGFRVEGRFVTQSLLPTGNSWIVRVDVPVESLTAEGDGLPSLRARRLSKMELALRLLPHASVRDWMNPRRLRASVPAPVVEPYGAWVQAFGTIGDAEAANVRAAIAGFSLRPKISIVMPVYNTDETWLREAIESVQGQLYENWELCIADDASTAPHVRRVLDEAARADARVRVVYRDRNGHISAASNSALEIAEGEFTALLDHDDRLAPHALASVVHALNAHPETDLFYSDEDKIDAFGRRYEPNFKPDWNPELFYSMNCVSHLSVFRTELLRRIGGFTVGLEGSQDYDLVLRVVERTTPERIRHIHDVLYHWRAIAGSVALGEGEKGYAHERAREAIRRHFDRRGTPVRVTAGAGHQHRVHYPVPQPEPGVSILVPTRDRRDLLEPLIEDLRTRTDYERFEVIVVDNQTTDPETLDYFRILKQDPRIRILRYDAAFNYSAIINLAAREARFPILALVNNDLRVRTKSWLAEMVALVSRPEIGCVGAKLLYPNGTLQHAGVYLGIGGVADQLFRHYPADSKVWLSRLLQIQAVSAVSAACLLVRKDVFDAVGGFDEVNLTVAYNDVDFCLKVREAGFRNVWTPYAELTHVESASRGSDADASRRARFDRETAWMKKRWGSALENDPFYSPIFSLKRPVVELAFPPRHVLFYRVNPAAQSTKSPTRSAMARAEVSPGDSIPRQ